MTDEEKIRQMYEEYLEGVQLAFGDAIKSGVLSPLSFDAFKSLPEVHEAGFPAVEESSSDEE